VPAVSALPPVPRDSVLQLDCCKPAHTMVRLSAGHYLLRQWSTRCVLAFALSKCITLFAKVKQVSRQRGAVPTARHEQ